MVKSWLFQALAEMTSVNGSAESPASRRRFHLHCGPRSRAAQIDNLYASNYKIQLMKFFEVYFHEESRHRAAPARRPYNR
jgi:hypothetical protein